ncbi:MAG TPA: hypothetical protein VL485_06410 [Ktedonobacteraceae bacterium]|nr:hypothetical protein [Ktedonobacteraceae bacterium]
MAKRRSSQATRPAAPSKPIASTAPNQTTTEAIAPTQAQPLTASAPPASSKPTVRIVFPKWPVSKPGPWTTPPPPGMRPVNALRPEQVMEIGYDQETGESGPRSATEQSTGQTKATQNAARKHKKERL